MDEQLRAEVTEEQPSFWDHHRYLLLVSLTVIISGVLVAVSMTIYSVSGAALLDFSRPGVKSISNQVDRSNELVEYGASGPVNTTTINEFTNLYDTQAAKAKAVDAFNGDPLNPEVLEFSDGTASN